MTNTTLRAEDFLVNDITPSDWVYRSLNAFNYLWQVNYSCCVVFEENNNKYFV
jgi:hypothetical protein